MQPFASISRRRAIGTLFCSSAALALNLRCTAQAELPKNGLNFLAIGDFGTGGADQKRVAQAMAAFVSKNGLKPDALWLLGDNFYNEDKAGFSTESPRWKRGIEEMYPASAFPGPMHVVLGNHDYHDNLGGDQVQLAYAKKPGVRWNLPAKWYRLDLGKPKPLVTFLCLDSNVPLVSGGGQKKSGKIQLSLTQEELEGKFTSFVVSGGGGAKVRQLNPKHTIPFAREIQGFTCLSVTEEALRFTHYDTDGQQLHSFQKKPDGSVVIEK